MTVRRKFLLITLVTMAALVAMVSIFAMVILLGNACGQEQDHAVKIVGNAIAALADQMANLDKVTVEYASWDDAYAFIQGLKPDFIQSNFNNAALAQNNFSLLLMADEHDRFVWGKRFDTAAVKELPLSPQAASLLAKGSPLLAPHMDSCTTGILVLDDTPLLISTHPILRSEYKGPPKGTLLIGRVIDRDMINRISNILTLPLQTHIVSAQPAPEVFKQALAGLSPVRPFMAQARSRQFIDGYGLLPDVHGKPALLLRVTVPRTFHQQFLISLGYFMAAFILLGLVLSALFYWLTSSLVLSRLERLDAFVKSIGGDEDLAQRLSIPGHDEISGLAGAVGQMLERIQAGLAQRVQAEEAHQESERRLEEQLRHTQKMEAIGQLAGGIAHDFNNLLTAILAYANTLKREADCSGNVRQAAEMIERAGQRARELTCKLLGFARRGKFLSIPIDMNSAIQEVIALLSRTLDKNIVIVQKLGVHNLSVLGDPGQISQVFLNLAINARDAMTGGGELTFTTCVADHDPTRDACCPELPAGRYLQVTVSDTGSGIPAHLREHIFEPFFTTKEPGKGTGMGLAMSYGIIRNHGGAIRVDSEEGRGTTFTIWFPCVAAEPAPSLQVGAIQTAPINARIMIIDDEELALNAAAHILTHLGYAVETFSDPRRALDHYRLRAAQIDLVIVDLSMPDIDGRECFRRLRTLNPAGRFILTSGYDRAGHVERVLEEGMAAFLPKPYDLAQLSRIVAEALLPA